jgi:hypothetical protein
MNPFFGTVGFPPFTNSFGQCFPGCCGPTNTWNPWGTAPAWTTGSWNPAFNQTPWNFTNTQWNSTPTFGWNNTAFNAFSPFNAYPTTTNTFWNTAPFNAWTPFNTWSTNPFFFNQFQPFPGTFNTNPQFNAGFTPNFQSITTQNGTVNPNVNGSCAPTGTIPTNLNGPFTTPNTLGFFGTSFFNPLNSYFGFTNPAQFTPNAVAPFGNFQPMNFGFQPNFVPGIVTPNIPVGIPSATGYVTPGPIDADQQTQKRSMARGVA